MSGTKAERAPRTIEDIESKLDLCIFPAFGSRPVSAVDERDIRDLARSASGKSRATVTNVLSTASGFFAWAVREKLAATNPVRVAREVYGEELLLPDDEPREARALTDDEIAAAMEHVGETFAPIVSFTAETGLRISEVLGPLRAGSTSRLKTPHHRRGATRKGRHGTRDDQEQAPPGDPDLGEGGSGSARAPAGARRRRLPSRRPGARVRHQDRAAAEPT